MLRRVVTGIAVASALTVAGGAAAQTNPEFAAIAT